MYSSAMSQPDAVEAVTSANPEEEQEKEQDCDFEPCREAPLRETQEETQEETQAIAAEESLENAWPQPIHTSVNQMLCASQTLDAVTLTPEVVPPPVSPQLLLSPPALYSPRLAFIAFKFPRFHPYQNSVQWFHSWF